MMKTMFPYAIFAATMFISAAHAEVPSYYTSPPTRPLAYSNTSTGYSQHIVTPNHFNNYNPYVRHGSRPPYYYNQDETTIDPTYTPTIQLNCTHDDSCLPVDKDK